MLKFVIILNFWIKSSYYEFLAKIILRSIKILHTAIISKPILSKKNKKLKLE